ncbi:DUF1036 domain-containing protein [Paenibacillus sp. ACRRX]|uniref:DUF1036 domain-containing protein n=1 Tax=Paenibacillus sp. ACRRX TaxID=2918206 RepID=UPI001EF5B742|nr:DUF1036 domain-containing protein [Paenibacillus sp. ACRRX]
MGFYVRNSTPNPIYVAVGYYDAGCSPVTYTKVGWYRITPGRSSLLVTGSSVNQTYYVYAYDTFNNVWDGNYFTYVPTTAFSMCWIERCQGAGCRRVGFDRVDVGNFINFTLNLINSTNGTSIPRNTRVSKKRKPKFILSRLSLKKLPGKLGKLGKIVRPLYGRLK